MSATSSTMTGGMMNTAMMAAVAYARRGVCEAMAAAMPPSSSTVSSPWSRMGSRLGDSSSQPVPGSGAVEQASDEQQQLRHEHHQQQPGDQPAGPRQRVVGPRQGAREVQRQHAEALVATEQLGRLGGAEEHHEHGDDAGVGVVLDGREADSRREPPGPACAMSAAMPTATMAGMSARPASAKGTILARAPRPMP